MQRVIPIDSPYFLDLAGIEGRPDWPALFGTARPLALEIGCGVGDFIIQEAEAHPEWNFIALDYYNQGCLKTCKRLQRYNIANVRVLRVEAREFMAERLAPASLAAVYINCPDPWPKTRHRKRRLVQQPFVEFLRDYLAPGGLFNFATDFSDYGLEVAAFMPKVAGLENCLAPDLYRHELPDYHLSKYMRKFLAQGERIHFVRYRKP